MKKGEIAIAALSMLLLVTAYSCGSRNKDLIGEWKRTDYMDEPALNYNTSIEQGFIFYENGKGVYRRKYITTHNDQRANEAYEWAANTDWKTGKDNKGTFLIVNYHSGEVKNVVGEDKLKIEQEGLKIHNFYNGMVDTLYYRIENNALNTSKDYGDGKNTITAKYVRNKN